MFSPVLDGIENAAEAEAAATAAVEQLARALRDLGRVSDAIGRLGPNEFAIIAQGTDSAGAVKMAERFTQALIETAAGVPLRMRMAAGFDAVPNYHEAPIDPADMLARATMAMRLSRSDTAGEWIRQFEPPTTN